MSNYSELTLADANLKGTGVVNSAKSLGADKRIFLAESTFTGTAAQLKTQAYWDAAILAGTVIPFPQVQEIEPQDVEASYYESASGDTYLTKEEKRKTMYEFIESIVTHSGMKSHSDRSWNIWYYTEKGYLRCHSLAEDSFEGLKASRFYVNAQKTPTFSDPSKTPVIVEHDSVDDWDLEFGVIQPDFNMLDLEGVIQINAYSVSSTQVTGTLTVNVTLTVEGTNAILTGALIGNMQLKDASGDVITITSSTETGSTGVYVIVATDTAVAGTVQLIASSLGGSVYKSNVATYTTS